MNKTHFRNHRGSETSTCEVVLNRVFLKKSSPPKKIEKTSIPVLVDALTNARSYKYSNLPNITYATPKKVLNKLTSKVYELKDKVDFPLNLNFEM